MRAETARARALRRDATPTERILCRAIRNGGLKGAKARRQLPCGPYIVDFAFMAQRLIVEVDGETHYTDEGATHDIRRDIWLRNQGWRVLRFTNRDVLENIEGVLTAIAETLNHPHPNPLP